MRALAAVAAGALLCAGPTAAEEPADMVDLAERLAAQGPRGLSARGPSSVPNYPDARFRNVRANYKRFELVNDRIVFCGQISVKMPDGNQVGWTDFAYLPGSPPILVTAVEGLGLREVGPYVLRNMCKTGEENWLSQDYSKVFETRAVVPAFGVGVDNGEN